MDRYPYITPYVNEIFSREKQRFDYVFIRPILLVLYFLVRCVLFPLKFLIHRRPYGFEPRLIDRCLTLGMKYLATADAAELLVRHVQIEPLLYRYILTGGNPAKSPAGRPLQGIDGDFSVDSFNDIVWNSMTVAHDELSYEVIDRFDREQFLSQLPQLRATKPLDHESFRKGVLEENRRHSWQLLGCTNVVMLIVLTITIFGDLQTTVKALNSFGSDSVLLWCLKHIFAENPDRLIDLDFYMQVSNNRGHYNSSAFFSDPSQYLYYHIVFDEFAYDILMHSPRTDHA